MAWTAPKTWSSGEVVTAANMNTHLRDNMLAVGPHLIVRKPSDESVSASATLQNDDHLILPLGSNEAWEFRFLLAISSGSASDFKMAFNAPAGATLYCTLQWADTVGNWSFMDLSGTSFPTAPESLFVPTALISVPLVGTIVNSSTAGNLTLQWAQATASGTTTVKANSTLWGVKLA